MVASLGVGGLLVALVLGAAPGPPPLPVELDAVEVYFEALPHARPAPRPAGGGGAGAPARKPPPAAPAPEPAVEPPETPPERPTLDPSLLSSLGRVTAGGWGEGPGAGAGGGAGAGPGGAGAGVGGPDRALQVRREVYPRFPKEARKFKEDALCGVLFTVDAEGVPTDIEVDTCGPIFRPAVLEAVWKWRFYPLLVNGVAQPATFKLRVRFKVR